MSHEPPSQEESFCSCTLRLNVALVTQRRWSAILGTRLRDGRLQLVTKWVAQTDQHGLPLFLELFCLSLSNATLPQSRSCARSLFCDMSTMQRKVHSLFYSSVCPGMLIFINCAYVKWGTLIQDIFTYAKLMALFLIIIVGILKISSGKITWKYENITGNTINKRHML